MEQSVYPNPPRSPENAPFWEAAREGRFLIKRCNACGEAHWYPRALCPFCFSADTAWEECSGEGEIYTFSVTRKSPRGAYAVGYVTLDAGPSVYTNFVDCDFDALRIGAKVKVLFKPAQDGTPLPFFSPAT